MANVEHVSQQSDQPDQRLVLQQAMRALDQMQARLDAAERRQHEPVAIIGIGCRFPGGAHTPTAFWHLLREGVDAITEVPPERWAIDAWYNPDPDAPGTISTRYGGFVESATVEGFDAAFFGIAPREAITLDPQQRMLLEVCWEALEHAGQPPDQLVNSRSGVFVGMSSNDYAGRHLTSGDASRIDAYSYTGTSFNVAVGRISYLLGLQGPNVAIDTACSSSLTAVHLACQSLRSSECDVALAGGVNLILAPELTIVCSRLRALAPDGRCKSFDAAADGYARSEGCGVVVLKRLSDALAQGDTVLAVIRGSAINHDGPASGLTVPNGQAQQALIREALKRAQVAPADIGYVEAHGSGTPLGDPIEARALAAVLSEGRGADQPCRLGAVKTNIGHLEAAAGIAGLIKVVLALQHEAIPPHLHLRQINPRIGLAQLPLEIPTRMTAWSAGDTPRFAGVSSFGLSGTNVHVILGEAPQQVATGDTAPPAPYLLPLSARSKEALYALVQSYAQMLADNPTLSLPHLCAAASTRRSHHQHRLALVCTSSTELREQLAAVQQGHTPTGSLHSPSASRHQPRVVFVFPGQGAQWIGMGRQLLQQEPIFASAIAACEAAMQPWVDWSLRDVLTTDAGAVLLPRIDVVQPTLFAIQVALARLWQAWGITPVAVIGHSMGEVAAAHIAGSLSLPDAAQVICERSRLLRRISGQGAMAVVELSWEAAQNAIRHVTDRLSVAVSNSSRSTVLSGDPAALDAVLSSLGQQGVFCRRVQVDVASHSPQVERLRDALFDALAAIRPQAGSIPLYSAVTGQATDGADYDATYWVRNLREPVLFADTVQQIIRDGYRLFLELSPHPLLLPALQEMLATSAPALHETPLPAVTLPSLRREYERETLVDTLAALYVAGHTVNWSQFYADCPASGHDVPLPAYPWQRERFWIGYEEARRTADQRSTTQRATAAERPTLLGTHINPATTPDRHIWELAPDYPAQLYLDDHRVRGTATFPAAAYLVLCISMAHSVLPPDSVTALTLERVQFQQLLTLPNDVPNATPSVPAVQFVLHTHQIGLCQFEVYARLSDSDTDTWSLHASGAIAHAPASHAEPPTLLPLTAIKQRCDDKRSAADHYQRAAAHGLEYGAHYRQVAHIQRRSGEALAWLHPVTSNVPDDVLLDPALIDCCLQTMLAALPHADGSDDVLVPVAVERLHISAPPLPGTACYGYACLRDPADALRDPADAMSYSSDLYLADEQGRVLVTVHGLTVQRMVRAPRSVDSATDHWLYALEWQPASLPKHAAPHPSPSHASCGAPAASAAPDAPAASGAWLVLADRQGRGAALATLLEQRGGECTVLTAETPAHTLAATLSASTHYWRGVVYMWALDTTAVPFAPPDTESLKRAAELVRTLAGMGWRDMPRLWFVTSGTQPVAVQDVQCPEQAPLWGLGQGIVHEHPELRCTRVDLNATHQDNDLTGLLAELLADAADDQVALRQGQRYVARLVRQSLPAHNDNDAAPDVPLSLPDAAAFRLEQTRPGNLDSLALHPCHRREPGPGEVEIEVYAAGLNFLDVLLALGALPSDRRDAAPLVLGAECVGRVVALGNEDTSALQASMPPLHIGQEVVAIAPHSFGTHTTTSRLLVVPKPAQLSPTEAATLPVAFLTAYYALYQIGRLVRGERVLIHAAAGGVGLAAVWLAQRIGAEVFATAGSEEKRALLHTLGVRHVCDSRSLAFAEEIMHCTAGEGVDIVLNSLAGDSIGRSLSIVRDYGRFVELGKRDYYRNMSLGMQPFLRNLTFSLVDLRAMFTQRPALIQQLLQEVMALVSEEAYRPLPYHVFPIQQARAAFRMMAHAQHIGKLVLTIPATSQRHAVPQPPAATATGGGSVRTDASYLITGGLGGLGLAVAHWMVEQGARSLVLVGRRAPDEAAVAAIEQMQHAGARVTVLSVDVSQYEQLAHAFRRVDETLPPLRGVVHAAGVLDDALLVNMQPQQFENVLAPKVAGTWHLHWLTRQRCLDWFVCFSSAVTLLGLPGQASYVAANAFLDALAHYRRAQGLPALTINWGPWEAVGLAAAEVNRGKRLSFRGLPGIAPQQGTALFGQLLQQWPRAQIGVIPLHVRQWRQSFPSVAGLPSLSTLPVDELSPQAPQTLQVAIHNAEPDQQAGLVAAHVREQVGQVMRLAPEQIDAHAPLSSLGMDSLMTLELRNRLEMTTGLTLPATLVWTYPTIAALGRYLYAQMQSAVTPVQPEPAASEANSPDLDDLSAQDLAALLDDTIDAMQTFLPDNEQ